VQKNKIQFSLFGKIVAVIFVFTTLIWFITNRSQSLQYHSTDAIYDYQNLILHEFLVTSWAQNINNRDTLHKIIKSDLNKLHQMAYIGIFEDVNQNQELNFNIDLLVDSINFMKISAPFNAQSYISYMDTPTLSTETLNLEINDLYVSYGEYISPYPYRGTTNLPAVFVEYPINNNKILGVWFITDYNIGLDIYWPAIIVPISILIMLGVLFIIINSFLYPIKLIRTHVINLKKGNLHSTIPISTSDELGQLSRSINKMTRDIDVLVSQKQNLLIDVSHELKTPLTRLKFLLANMEIGDENKNSINKEINFLQDMISNMLLSDKLSTPYVEDLERTSITVQNLIDDACGMFYEIDKKLKITNKVPSITLNVDKYKLSLAIKNIIDNAIKYGSKTKLIELQANKIDANLKISIQDFGEGIDKNKLKKIMQPLYRGRAAKEKSSSGFGLGLAITKKIVDAHGGSLKIDSIVGKGTTFVILIPINNEKHK
tara:strand:+ start:1624 stop:3084 length:1461 start_codon:yes stop_codon:yes gene_type:complete